MANRKRKAVKTRPAPAAPAPAPAAAGDRVRRTIRLVVILYLFLGALYATHLPFGSGPDESAHYRYIQYLAQHHHLPRFNRTHPGSDYEFHQPPLYYLVTLPTYLLTAKDPISQEIAARFVGLLLGLALLYLTYALARALVPDRPWLAIASAGLVAFLPMHLALAASVGNDVLSEVFFGAALVILVHYLRAAAEYGAGERAAPPAATSAALLGLMIGLGVLTKSMAVLLLPVAWAALALAGEGRAGYDGRRVARDIALSAGVALAVSGWWLVRNQLLYGDLLAQNAFLSAFKDRPSPQDVMVALHLSPGGYARYALTWLFDSVLGVFGPSGTRFIFFPRWVYAIAGVVDVLAAAGFVAYLVRGRLTEWQRRTWLVVAVVAVLLAGSLVRFNASFFQAQARYLFPVLPAAAVAFSLGVEQFAPARRRAWVSSAMVILLALVALVALPVWIVPRFVAP